MHTADVRLDGAAWCPCSADPYRLEAREVELLDVRVPGRRDEGNVLRRCLSSKVAGNVEPDLSRQFQIENDHVWMRPRRHRQGFKPISGGQDQES
jgi:hypothetical protein